MNWHWIGINCVSCSFNTRRRASSSVKTINVVVSWARLMYRPETTVKMVQQMCGLSLIHYFPLLRDGARPAIIWLILKLEIVLFLRRERARRIGLLAWIYIKLNNGFLYHSGYLTPKQLRTVWNCFIIFWQYKEFNVSYYLSLIFSHSKYQKGNCVAHILEMHPRSNNSFQYYSAIQNFHLLCFFPERKVILERAPAFFQALWE